MAPNTIKTKEEETMLIKEVEEVEEVIKEEEEEGGSTDMFAPAWVQESTQVLKTKVGTKILTLRTTGKDDNPNCQSREDEDENGEVIEDLELAEIDQVQIWIDLNIFECLKAVGHSSN